MDKPNPFHLSAADMDRVSADPLKNPRLAAFTGMAFRSPSIGIESPRSAVTDEACENCGTTASVELVDPATSLHLCASCKSHE